MVINLAEKESPRHVLLNVQHKCDRSISVSDSAKLQYEEFLKVICKLGVLKQFWLKNLTKKIDKILKDFLTIPSLHA